MSPHRMFQSWGSSSIAVLRIQRPIITHAVVLGRLYRARLHFRIRPHRPEFQSAEPATTATDAVLAIEHRAAVFEFDGGGQQQPER